MTWVAIISPVLALGGLGYAGITKLTRIAVAIERLTADMSRIAGRVDNHERRLTYLEVRQPGRHRTR